MIMNHIIRLARLHGPEPWMYVMRLVRMVLRVPLSRAARA
jgi:hypothetical protein